MPDDTPDDAPADTPSDTPEGAESSFDAAAAAAELAEALGDRPAEAAAGGNYTAILEDEVETLGRLLADKDRELQAAHDKAEAARAEVDRVRARLERDAASTIERGRRKVLESFLDVADDLHRAAGELTTNGVDPALAQGVVLVRDKLRTVLVQHGARHRPSLGEPFDSAHHEAIGTVPPTDSTPAGSIAAVLREGYELDGQILRAARVIVAKE